MLHKFLILFLFTIAFQSGVFAQEKKKDTIPETKREKVQEKKIDITPETKGEKAQEKKPYSLSQFVHETYLFVIQPTKWKGSDWLKVGVVTVVTIAVMPLDKTGFNSTQGNQHYYYSVPVVGGRVYGEWYSIGGVAGVFGVYGLIARNDASKKIAIELLQAGIYAEAVTEVFKIAIGRARPSTTDNSFSYKPFNINNTYNSMPSGHTTAAMALSTVMSRHANTTLLKILAYVPAGFTMFSRIYQNKHWLSDVVPAAAVGYFTGNWVVDLHEGKRHRINVTSVYPTTISISLNRESP
jgi:membrane-associated phospholipid phosphatase